MIIQLNSAKFTDRQELTYIVAFLNIAGLWAMIADRDRHTQAKNFDVRQS